MMVYVHENFADKITVSDLAKVGYISERDCFSSFSRVSSHDADRIYYKLSAAKSLLYVST